MKKCKPEAISLVVSDVWIYKSVNSALQTFQSIINAHVLLISLCIRSQLTSTRFSAHITTHWSAEAL